MSKLSNLGQVQEYISERQYANRIRDAIQFCRQETGIMDNSDCTMLKKERMAIEQCLTKNFLVAKGMDYFGKKDLIYIDMLATSDIQDLNTKEFKRSPWDTEEWAENNQTGTQIQARDEVDLII